MTRGLSLFGAIGFLIMLAGLGLIMLMSMMLFDSYMVYLVDGFALLLFGGMLVFTAYLNGIANNTEATSRLLLALGKVLKQNG